MSILQVENRVGRPIKAGKYEILPIERAWRIQSPGHRFFAFWRRPASVIVLHPGGDEETLSIPDPTRQAQILIWGMALFIPLMLWLLRRIKPQEKKDV